MANGDPIWHETYAGARRVPANQPVLRSPGFLPSLVISVQRIGTVLPSACIADSESPGAANHCGWNNQQAAINGFRICAFPQYWISFSLLYFLPNTPHGRPRSEILAPPCLPSHPRNWAWMAIALSLGPGQGPQTTKKKYGFSGVSGGRSVRHWPLWKAPKYAIFRRPGSSPKIENINSGRKSGHR